MARIDHNVEECYSRYCNSQVRYKMRSDDFSPDKLTQSHWFSRFCLPSSAHCLKNENKLSMEISCQLFWNKQYKLLNNYVWRTHKAVELEAYQQGPKCPNCLGRCQEQSASQFLQPKWVTLSELYRFTSKSISWWVLRWIFFVSKFSWSSKSILSKT